MGYIEDTREIETLESEFADTAQDKRFAPENKARLLLRHLHNMGDHLLRRHQDNADAGANIAEYIQDFTERRDLGAHWIECAFGDAPEHSAKRAKVEKALTELERRASQLDRGVLVTTIQPDLS